MIRVGRRHPQGPIQIGQRGVCGVCFRALNPAFYLAHGFKILVDPGAIARAHFSFETRNFVVETVQQAGALSQGRLTFSRLATLSKQAFKYDSRMRFSRQRRGG